MLVAVKNVTQKYKPILFKLEKSCLNEQIHTKRKKKHRKSYAQTSLRNRIVYDKNKNKTLDVLMYSPRGLPNIAVAMLMQ